MGEGRAALGKPTSVCEDAARSVRRLEAEGVAMSRARVLIGAIAVFLAAVALGTPAAHATFPGGNGKIAFSSNRSGNVEIYVMRHDGSGVRRLTHSPGFDTYL